MKISYSVFITGILIGLLLLSGCSILEVPTVTPQATPSPTLIAVAIPSTTATTVPLPTPTPLPTSTPLPTLSPTPAPPPSATPSPTPFPGAERPFYHFAIQLDYTGHQLQVEQTVAIKNRSQQPWTQIVFNVFANNLGNTFHLDSSQVILSQASTPVQANLDGFALSIPLATPLPAEGEITIALRYTLKLPPMTNGDNFLDGYMGWNDRLMNLGAWYPVLAPFRGESGWEILQRAQVGDPYIAEMANYQVEIKAPASITLAGSGLVEQRGDTWAFQLKQTRSFAFTASDQYQQASGMAGNIRVTSYFFPEHAQAGRAALETTINALNLYSHLFVPYPYATYAVAEGAAFVEYGAFHTGRAEWYADYKEGTRNWLTTLTAHEVAHQWWYGLVGNDQAIDPWLDEALATYTERIFYENQAPQDLEWWWGTRIGPGPSQDPVNGTIYTYRDLNSYTNGVYHRGAQFYEEFRKLVGDQTFFAFLKDWAQQENGKLATVNAFWELASYYTKEDLTALRRKYFFATPSGLLSPQTAQLIRLPAGSVGHPLAAAVLSDTLYLADLGQLKAISLAKPDQVQVLLPSKDGERRVEGIPIQDLLALSAGKDGNSLILLDRSGYTFRYVISTAQWSLARPAREDYYLTSLSSGIEPAPLFHLLNNTLGVIFRSDDIPGPAIAKELGMGMLEDTSAQSAGAKDAAAQGTGSIYVLLREGMGAKPDIQRYLAPAWRLDAAFKPAETPVLPLDLALGGGKEPGLYVLDQEGQRILKLDKNSGAMLRTLTSPAGTPPFTTLTTSGDRLIVAGRDTLVLYPGNPADGANTSQTSPGSGNLAPSPPVSTTLISYLDRLPTLPKYQMPINGAHLAPRDEVIPGAPRQYRAGIHEGSDFYSGEVGVGVGLNTPVVAIGPGTVIRADTDYQDPSPAILQGWLDTSTKLGYTPPDILDYLRGRQVWLDLGNGLIARYCHLSRIAPEINKGSQVKPGDILGYIGNSGTPESMSGPTVGLHLHFEMVVDGHYVGQYLRPVETRRWLEKLLGQSG
ncbi:MAG: hypothetical protein EXR62_15530 [Chloroflexi bacterium]|nr:hypothetical protein [Chloroflexota bacterium]